MTRRLCDEEDVDLQFSEELSAVTPESIEARPATLERQEELFALLDRLQEVED